MLGNCLENLRRRAPLVHNITNYVTVNDVANVLLAIGGSPIMSDDIDEVEDITTICSALNINIGTLNQRTIPAMFRAGKRANALNNIMIPQFTATIKYITEVLEEKEREDFSRLKVIKKQRDG